MGRGAAADGGRDAHPDRNPTQTQRQTTQSFTTTLTLTVQVQKAAEGVMLANMGGFLCGGCDCLDTLAGKVLT